jgi:hypothetical protein
MTIEDLQAELESLKSGNDALASKNKELLMELKTTRAKVKEVDFDEYYRLKDENDELKTNYSKLEKTYKSETEKLSKSLADKEGFLTKTLLDDGLTQSLVKVGVKAEFLEATKALLKSQAKLDDNYAPMIGDKGLNDFITEWSSGDGKHFITAPANGGGGAKGGSRIGGNDMAKYFDKNSPDFNLTEQAEIFNTNPELYKQMKG